jgi:hypothetical protein
MSKTITRKCDKWTSHLMKPVCRTVKHKDSPMKMQLCRCSFSDLILHHKLLFLLLKLPKVASFQTYLWTIVHPCPSSSTMKPQRKVYYLQPRLSACYCLFSSNTSISKLINNSNTLLTQLLNMNCHVLCTALL